MARSAGLLSPEPMLTHTEMLKHMHTGIGIQCRQSC